MGSLASPRVTGRVLDSQTRQALAGVLVGRGRPDTTTSSSPPKGAELLTRKPDILTDADGTFTLASEHVLSLLPWGGWSYLHLTFERAGYERFVTNISITQLSTNAPPDADHVVHTGDILLHPKAD
jgi:hypothetical protein